MALCIPHNIFHLARLLYVTPETFGPYYVRRIIVFFVYAFSFRCLVKYVYGLFCPTASTYVPSSCPDPKFVAGTKIRIGLCCSGNGDNNKDTKLN